MILMPNATAIQDTNVVVSLVGKLKHASGKILFIITLVWCQIESHFECQHGTKVSSCNRSQQTHEQHAKWDRNLHQHETKASQPTELNGAGPIGFHLFPQKFLQRFLQNSCPYPQILHRHHLHSSTFIYIHLHSSTFIYIHLHSSTFIYIHLHSSAFICIHLHSSAFIYIHLHSSTFYTAFITYTPCITTTTTTTTTTTQIHTIGIVRL